MKTKLLFLVILMLLGSSSNAQRQKFNIFGTSIKAKDITGVNSFNDLGVYNFTSVINNLTDDTDTYLWRLGSIRLDSKNFRKGTIPLFDLAYANHKEGYDILDLIDLEYYKDWGFTILETKDTSIVHKKGYKEFKKNILNETNTNNFRSYLWDDDNRYFRNILFKTKYVENIQQVSNKFTKNYSNNLTINLNIDLDSLKQFAKSNKIDSVKFDSFSKFKKALDRTLELKGIFISVTFNYRYIDYINEHFKKLDSLREDNEFNEHFNDYLKSKKANIRNQTPALNSALFAFRFDGDFDKTIIDTTYIRAHLGAGFSVKEITNINTYIKDEYKKQINDHLTNSFSKVWIIGFGTDAILEDLKFKVVEKEPKKLTK